MYVAIIMLRLLWNYFEIATNCSVDTNFDVDSYLGILPKYLIGASESYNGDTR